jgi:hypothetical protein
MQTTTTVVHPAKSHIQLGLVGMPHPLMGVHPMPQGLNITTQHTHLNLNLKAQSTPNKTRVTIKQSKVTGAKT